MHQLRQQRKLERLESGQQVELACRDRVHTGRALTITGT
jgi:hypothetical protein